MGKADTLKTGHKDSMAGDQPLHDCAHAGFGLLLKDCSYADLEWVPRARRTKSGMVCQDPSDPGVRGELPLGRLSVRIEGEDVPRALHHVDEAFPMRSVCP